MRGLRLRGHCKSFIDAHMRGVGFFPESIDDEMRHAANLFNHRRRHGFAVAKIGRQFLTVAREEISEGCHAAMRNRQGSKECRTEGKRLRYDVRFRMHVARKAILSIESEEKYALEILEGLVRSINWQGPRIRAKWPQVIQSEHVIGMGVREDDGIDAPNILAQTLHAEICSRINYERRLRRFHING